MVEVAPAGREDLESLLRIASARRAVYAGYQPRFWHPAPDAVDRQRSHLGSVLDDDEALVLKVTDGDAAPCGFAVGRLVPAPPVYDPGGPSCLVDDFAVADPRDWPAMGHLLLDALWGWAAGRGAAQMVVVTAHLDGPQRAALRAYGLDLASEWWVGSPGPDQAGT